MIEQSACAALGIAPFELMTRAGAAALAVLQAHFSHARTVAVLIGPGNNGGDGWVLARLARAAGLEVSAYCAVEATALRNDAAIAFAQFASEGGTVSPLPVLSADVYVDALLGIGVRGDLTGSLAELAAAAVPERTLALDLPSGLCADTGFAFGGAVSAHVTVCFVAPKLGLLTGAGPALSGEVVLADLGLAAFCSNDQAQAINLTAQAFSAALPPRARSAHKGRFGHVLAIGGDHGMAGAIRLCAEAAQRAGAGLVSVLTRPEHAIALIMACPELMAPPLDAKTLATLAARTIVIGPGLGQSQWSAELLEKVLALPQALVLDADALNQISAHSWVVPPGSILTPHPGEAARLLACTVAEVERNRPLAARTLAAQRNAVVVLKGAGTLIATPEGALWVCTRGNPGMASGGIGDTLAGVIAAFLAQGLSSADAARFGVYAHALAGDLAAKAGERGLRARDLIAQLRSAVNPHALPAAR